MKLIPRIDFSKLKNGLAKTRNNILNKISETITRRASVDESTIEALEETLISCDMGLNLTEKLLSNARKRILSQSDRSVSAIIEVIKSELISLLPFSVYNLSDKILNSKKPYVILVVGINGSGKTTTVGKLASRLKSEGLKVIIGSADTFRAAANDQLKVWAERAEVRLIEATSNDPASVAYDSIKAAIEDKADVVLIDTAGRLHNNKNLMNELSKIKKVIASLIPEAPHDAFLVIDGNSGQNALAQAKEFNSFVDLTGLILTKLDGTAKGGIVFKICEMKKLPVCFIGIGEATEDLQEFSVTDYINAIFSETTLKN